MLQDQYTRRAIDLMDGWHLHSGPLCTAEQARVAVEIADELAAAWMAGYQSARAEVVEEQVHR